MSNRNSSFIRQIASKESRTRFYTSLQEVLNPVSESTSAQSDPKGEGDTPRNLTEPYWLSDCAIVRDLRRWLSKNRKDRALHASIRLLSVLAAC